jgi:predicted alpha/beta-hydrolase family hydrolase
MKRYAHALSRLGRVETLDYPYMLAGRRSPDKLPKLLDAHRAALAKVREDHTGKVILAGKSMGSRIGCHLSLEEPVDGLVCFGYPLKGAGRTATLRDEVLRALTTPILFVQGTRDALCPLELLEGVRENMKARSQLVIVESGDHSLETTRAYQKQHQTSQQAVEETILQAVKAFVASL